MVAMSTAVFELLVANPSNAYCFCTTPPDKGSLEKLINGAIVCLEQGIFEIEDGVFFVG